SRFLLPVVPPFLVRDSGPVRGAAPALVRMVSSRELPLHQEIELYTDPNPAYAEVLRFLGLPAWRPSSFVNQSDPLGKRCRAAMSETTRKRLTEEFERYNRTLADLIGSHSRGAD